MPWPESRCLGVVQEGTPLFLSFLSPGLYLLAIVHNRRRADRDQVSDDDRRNGRRARSRRKALQSTEDASGGISIGRWTWSEHRSHNRHIFLDLCRRNVFLDLSGSDLIRHSLPAETSTSELYL